jgi:hypothetical protein
MSKPRVLLFLPRTALLAMIAVVATAWPGVPTRGDGFDPFLDEAPPKETVAVRDPFEDVIATPVRLPIVQPVTATISGPLHVQSAAYFPAQSTSPSPQVASPENRFADEIPPPGCGVPNEKPLGQLTIETRAPEGALPVNHAAACWEQLNSITGHAADVRFWAQQTYAWDAPCTYHRPLYFEEINLERYGYGCCECLQPLASAAHFFGTVPALPYCLAADCPGECQYTLGHYRPGSCPPWRCHRPPYSVVGGVSQAGVLTGLIFLIP